MDEHTAEDIADRLTRKVRAIGASPYDATHYELKNLLDAGAVLVEEHVVHVITVRYKDMIFKHKSAEPFKHPRLKEKRA